MLLKALYELAAEKRLLENVHVQQRKVDLLIPIKSDGTLATDGLLPLSSTDKKGKPVLGRPMLMPRFPGENNGGKAYFIAESCTYVLGIDTPSGESVTCAGNGATRAGSSFLHFWEQIETARDKTGLSQLDALMKFKERYLALEDGRVTHSLPFTDMREDKQKKTRVCGRTVAGEWIPLAKLVLSFQVDGKPVFRAEPGDALNQYWRETYGKLAFADSDLEGEGKVRRGLCLITEATDAPIARSHKPKILKIPGLTSGGYIVSFARECPSFSSFGFEMGENAPVSEEAAAAYVLALQSLLDSENHSLTIGPIAVCFWARKQTQQAGFIASMLKRADPGAVTDFLKSPWAGIDRELSGRDRFYSVSLSGNAGRVVVRHWMQVTVEQARESLRRWFADLEIVQLYRESGGRSTDKSGKGEDDATKSNQKEMHPMALFRLACATVRDAKNLRSDIVAHLYRAALEGTSPSLSLVKPVLSEFHRALLADSPTKPRYPYSLSRFALLRLILNRNRRGSEPMIEPQLAQTEDPAYNCGRLLAVLAEAQERAHDFKLEGPGIAERYFGTASVSPSSVFPLLIRLNRHHLEKIKKSEKKSHAWFIEAQIQEIMALFRSECEGNPPQFPRHLNLQAQGRFALGFYQQKAAAEAERAASRQKKRENKSQVSDEVTT